LVWKDRRPSLYSAPDAAGSCGQAVDDVIATQAHIHLVGAAIGKTPQHLGLAVAHPAIPLIRHLRLTAAGRKQQSASSEPRESDPDHCFSSSATLFRHRASGLASAFINTLIILSGRGFDLRRAEYLAGGLPTTAGTTGQQHTNDAQGG
jgi:hypothetical protein